MNGSIFLFLVCLLLTSVFPLGFPLWTVLFSLFDVYLLLSFSLCFYPSVFLVWRSFILRTQFLSLLSFPTFWFSCCLLPFEPFVLILVVLLLRSCFGIIYCGLSTPWQVAWGYLQYFLFLLGLPFLPPLVLHFTEFSSFFTTWSAFLLELCSFEFCLLFSFSFFLLVYLDFWFLWVSDPFDCRFISFVASSGPVAFVLLEMPLRLLSLFLLTSSNSVLLTVGRNTFFLLVHFLVSYFELYSVFFISCYYSWFSWLCFFWGFLLWGGISIFTYLSVLRLSYVFHKSFV